jgi:hypothetical protein
MRATLLATLVLLRSIAIAQNQSGDMSGMDMSHMSGEARTAGEVQTKDMHDMPGMGSDGSAMAMHSMESHHMDMGPHMKMTVLHVPQPGDKARADQIVQAARTVAEKYKDYKVALDNGFKSSCPTLPKSNTTSRTIAMRGARESTSIQRNRPRCSMRNMGTITN